MRKLHDLKLQEESEIKRDWKPTVALERAEADVDFKLRFRGQQGTAGLGMIPNRRPDPNSQEYRRLVTETVCQQDEHTELLKTLDMPMQGGWNKWDQLMSLDLTWNNLIYGLPPKLLSFALNATQLTLPTPDRLRVWKIIPTSDCRLCHRPNCSLFHILCNCPFSLHSKRYNWRHDSVLRTIECVITDRIIDQNKRKAQPNSFRSIKFVPAGVKRAASHFSATCTGVLSHANDWQYLFDYDATPIVFPPSIYATDQRPDIVLWSATTKTLILIELTVPYEDNIADADFRKKAKYQDLVDACRNEQWDVYFQTIEIGVRGFVAGSFRKCLKLLGINNSTIARATSKVSKTALRCSYALYLARNLSNWKPLDLICDTPQQMAER
jgi:hypothetical protein